MSYRPAQSLPSKRYEQSLAVLLPVDYEAWTLDGQRTHCVAACAISWARCSIWAFIVPIVCSRVRRPS